MKTFLEWMSGVRIGGEGSLKHFANEFEALKAAVVRWKGNPSDMVIHMQDEMDGKPAPQSATGARLREMASALLKELKENSEPAPTLYRGDNRHADDNSSLAVGWTSNKKVAQYWVGFYGGEVHVLENANGVCLRKIVGDTLDGGEDEWIVLNKPRAGGRP